MTPRFYCEDCARWHPPAERQALIRRIWPCGASQVRKRFGSHPWPRTGAGERMLWRDLRAVRGYAIDRTAGAPQRLAQFLELVLERGICSAKAARLAHVENVRGTDALRALGYRYLNRGRWGNSGWFRRGKSGGLTSLRAAQ
jgi:hypothetical protein